MEKPNRKGDQIKQYQTSQRGGEKCTLAKPPSLWVFSFHQTPPYCGKVFLFRLFVRSFVFFLSPFVSFLFLFMIMMMIPHKKVLRGISHQVDGSRVGGLLCVSPVSLLATASLSESLLSCRLFFFSCCCCGPFPLLLISLQTRFFFVRLHHRLSTPLNPSRAIPRRFFFPGSLGFFRLF